MAETTASYRVEFIQPSDHCFRIVCELPAIGSQGQSFRLPAWVPGSYLVRDFAGNVVTVSATDDQGSYQPERLNKSTWHCRPSTEAVSLELCIHALDDSVRAAWFDQEYAFFNAAALLPEPIGLPGPYAVHLDNADEPQVAEWQLASSMPPVDVDSQGFGEYRVSDYAELIDHPVLAGKLQVRDFSVADCPHRLWIQGALPAQLDWDRLIHDLKAVCKEHVRQFGALPEMSRYDFLLRVKESGYGGLEHRASTAVVCSRADLPLKAEAKHKKQTADYRRLMGLLSHEYYHLWNVKRIRPQVVIDSDLQSEAHFSDLWAYEGVTSYYDNLGLHRSGVINTNRYLGTIADELNRLQRSAGRFKQSLAESGYEAWIKLYRTTPESHNLNISYYNKGALVALMLDLSLRLKTEGAYTLDHVMCALLEKYSLESNPAPEHALEKIAEDCAGVALDDFFARWVYGLDELTDQGGLVDLLAEFGVDCAMHAPRSDNDKLWSLLGIKLRQPAAGRVLQDVTLAAVELDSPAQQAGLMPDDVIVACAGHRVGTNFSSLLDMLDSSAPLELHFFREGVLRSTLLQPRREEVGVWGLKVNSEAAEKQKVRCRDWLFPEGSVVADRQGTEGQQTTEQD